ncbi:MAG: pentapeptide repeat-containing protein, partial [Methanothrix sp.]|nr:pentapeptide repeat-containing protein [Methanothrix sp.]
MEKIRPNLGLIFVLVLLPLAGAASEEGMAVVPAQEILDKIERGLPVEYDNVIIKGDLDLRKLDLPTRPVDRTSFEIEWLGLLENAMVVSSPIRVNDSTIDGNVYFNNTILNNSINFWNSDFEDNAYFMGSFFNDYACFSRSVFKGTADFSLSDFNDVAYFGGSNFNDVAYFGNSAFKGNAHFGNSAFKGNAHFGNSAFKGNANFYGSAFNSNADFMRSHFAGSQFTSTQFNKISFFNDAMFNGSTSFNSSRFKEDALFEGADFNGTLYLTRAKYDRLYISWKNIKELGYDDAAYLSLLENFKKLGYLEDYDACYYEYRRAHRDQSWSGKYHAMHLAEEWVRKRIDVGLEAFYGYGKRPIWPLLWSAGTIFFFGLFWRTGGLEKSKGSNQRGILERYGPQEPSWKPKRRYWRGELGALADALIFSTTIFLSGTRLFVDPPQMPQMHRWSA